jgi:hypothetical protein
MSIDRSSFLPSRTLVTAASLGLLALLCIAPLLAATIFAAILVLLLMGMALILRARLDRAIEAHPARNMLLFALLAAGMTLTHWLALDRRDELRQWQRRIYLQQFNGDYEAPHNYRPLPHGFVYLIDRLTDNWDFACLSYRWFFTVWFLWAAHRLARRYLDPSRALLALLPLPMLYPLSILRYWGQLTDPLSHTLFVLAFLYLLEDRPIALAAALALGILAKETVVIVVPAYLACYWRRGWRAWFIAAALGAACTAAFLAARLPLGWRPGAENMNGAGLMIGTNLGIGEPVATLPCSLAENYLHPLLFIGLFLPPILWRWRVLDPHLRSLFLVTTPLLLLSNVCFGWLAESRNYMPLVPLLATMALSPQGASLQSERKDCHKIGA